MTENEAATIIVDTAYQMHVALGPGLLESVYHDILVYELRKRHLRVLSKQPIPIVWDGLQFERAFVSDLIVQDVVIVELKSLEKVHPVHSKQLLTYLRLADKRLGLLINFGSKLIKEGISRVASGDFE